MKEKEKQRFVEFTRPHMRCLHVDTEDIIFDVYGSVDFPRR